MTYRVVPALPCRDVTVSLVMRSDRDVTTCQPRVPGVHGTSISSASRRHVCHTRWGVTSVGGALVFLSRPRSQTHVVTIVSDDSSQRLTSSNRCHMFIEVLLCQRQAPSPTLSLPSLYLRGFLTLGFPPHPLVLPATST